MGISLAGGWQIFGAFLVLFTIAAIYGLYTRRGSGINQRPYNSPYGDAPGARGASVLHHDETAARYSTRGTRSTGQRRPVRGLASRSASEEAARIFTRS